MLYSSRLDADPRSPSMADCSLCATERAASAAAVGRRLHAGVQRDDSAPFGGVGRIRREYRHLGRGLVEKPGQRLSHWRQIQGRRMGHAGNGHRSPLR